MSINDVDASINLKENSKDFDIKEFSKDVDVESPNDIAYDYDKTSSEEIGNEKQFDPSIVTNPSEEVFKTFNTNNELRKSKSYDNSSERGKSDENFVSNDQESSERSETESNEKSAELIAAHKIENLDDSVDAFNDIGNNVDASVTVETDEDDFELYTQIWTPMMKNESECCHIYSAYYETRKNFLGELIRETKNVEAF